LPPYHPIVYNHIKNNKEYKMVDKVEMYLNDYASENNIQLVGSYNPNRFNLNSIDFYDGMHPKDKIMKKNFK